MRLPGMALFLFLAVLPVAAQPTTPPDFVQLALTTVDRIVKGDYPALYATFDEKMRAALPEEKLRGTWASVQVQAGAFIKAGEPKLDSKGGFHIVTVPAEFANAKAEFVVAFNASGTIAGLNVRPAVPSTPFTDAAYVDRKAFTERDVTVDAGGWPLPGTLTVPVGAGPFPAVVLVHGSGPNDRDETGGPIPRPPS